MKRSAERNNSTEEVPKKKDPLRVAAIIELPESEQLLLVQSLKPRILKEKMAELDKKIESRGGKRRSGPYIQRMEIARKIVKTGIYSLPGGTIKDRDYIKAGAAELIDRKPENNEEFRVFREVAIETLIREIREEVQLELDSRQVRPILEINGEDRDHVIFLMQAKGRIQLFEEEVCGIGLFGEVNSIPQNLLFYQPHIVEVYKKYIQKETKRRMAKSLFQSRIEVPAVLIDRWHENEVLGHMYRFPKKGHKPPTKPVSTTSFKIVDPQGREVNPIEEYSFTIRRGAKVIPPDSSTPKKP